VPAAITSVFHRDHPTGKVHVDPRILQNIPGEIDGYGVAEMAIPSYFHRNPFVRYIIRARLDEILRVGGFSPADVVLDFGTGTGILIPELCQRVSGVIGTDLRTEIARRMVWLSEIPNARIVELDDFWTLPTNSVSKIVAADVLEHVENLDNLLDHFAKILKPGGRLIVSGPTESGFYKLCRRIAGFSGEYHLRSIFDIEARLAAKGYRTRVRNCLPVWLPTKMFVVLVCEAPPKMATAAKPSAGNGEMVARAIAR
jgi:SAM-dependent methyltransferase